ncbi:MAG: hypothetical protein O3C40_17685 [Planctomycetota bacterium]|nr:hypothetical protein [Planctomycetota bacterium]
MQSRQGDAAESSPAFAHTIINAAYRTIRPSSTSVMILNGYAILFLLLNFIRLPLALIVVIGGFSEVRGYPRRLQRESREDRSYLLMMLATWLVGLNVLSWPLFYWLLQSYVPEWPDVMCIYGVTQIGTGSLGASRFLPGMITAVQLLKPLLLFLCGSWFVIYWLNRRTEKAVLMRRVIAGSLLIGLVSVADSTLEASYVLTPKREDRPSVGCCTMSIAPRSSAFSAAGWLPENSNEWLYPVYYGVNTLMIAALVGKLSFPRRQSRNLWLGSLRLPRHRESSRLEMVSSSTRRSWARNVPAVRVVRSRATSTAMGGSSWSSTTSTMNRISIRPTFRQRTMPRFACAARAATGTQSAHWCG